MKKIKEYQSDIFLLFGLLSIGYGVYMEYSVGKSLIVCGSLVLLLGFKLIPGKG